MKNLLLASLLLLTSEILAQQPITWRTFYNDPMKWNISLPDNWTIDQQTPQGRVFFRAPLEAGETDYRDNLNIATVTYDENITLAQYTELVTTECRNAGYEDIKTEKVKFQGMDALQCSYQIPSPSKLGAVRLRQTTFLKDKVFYTLGFAAREIRFKQKISIADAMLKSFKFSGAK